MNAARTSKSKTAAQNLRAWCAERLAQHDGAPPLDPMNSPVRELAVALLQRLENGELDLGALEGLVQDLGDSALRQRTERFGEAHPARAWRDVVEAALAPLEGAAFETIKAALESPRAGAVFTAHPTFAMSRAMRDAVGAIASGDDADLAALKHEPDAPITLAYECEDASAALTRAQASLRALCAALYDWLQRHAGAEWHTLNPAPLRLATWVGYDLDGRTDIHWGQSIRIRLEEKARQLRHYAEALEGIGGAGALATRLAAAAEETETQAGLFAGDLDDADQVVAAANRLTRATEARLVSLGPEIEALGAIIDGETDTKRKRDLCVLRAEMTSFGLGAGAIHLRVNAAQVRGAVQSDLGLASDSDFFDRRAMTAAAERAADARQREVNFGSVFQEKKTARRQFMLCAEMLKHIDADAPVRFLIAEIESPATIMGAIYLARLYGVDHRLDVSPLFETADVLDRGGRFMERLLDEPEYLDYIRKRGRLCVQLGFSDSGRFMGQIAADMGIERLHVLLSRALAARGVRDVEVLIFNTHGESMGRGAFPGSLSERFDHLLTPWTRARFAHDGLKLHAEVSFQGGDGYLHFQNAALSDATLQALFAWAFAPTTKPDDAFYQDINFSWDIYRGVTQWQEELFDDAHYQTVLGAFAPNLLPATGSRKTRRQSGASKDDAARSLRAIPHNAILQTLAAPANVAGGFGAVAERERERFVAHVGASERLRRLVDMAQRARRLTSLSVLRTYADLYSPSFWTIRAARGDDDAAAEIALRVAARMEEHGWDTAIDRLANLLSSDRRRFDAVLRDMTDTGTGDKGFPAELYMLHAVRMALIVRGLSLVAAIPAFSARHDISREALLDEAMEARFADVAEQLAEIFPVTLEPPAAFDRLEESAAPNAARAGYPEIHQDVVEPLRALDAALKRITIAIAHFYGAFG